jgi:SET domain-containing protein
MYYYYATRDIEAGEELLVNYSEFEEKSQVGWVEFGVGAIIQD